MTKPQLIQALLCVLFSVSIYGQTNTTNLGDNSGIQGDNNSFFGNRSGQITTNNQNSFFGALSGRFNTVGQRNTFIGFNSGRNNDSGNNNSFVGFASGLGNISGINNSYVGMNTGRENADGNNNVFLGHSAGQNMTNGNRNVYLGADSGQQAMGSGNVFLGYRSGRIETGNNKLVIDNNDVDAIPLVYGDFASGQLGINTTVLPSNMAFAVGGNAIINGTLYTNGKLSIGTTGDDPDYDLTVKGKIHAQEVRVDLDGAIAPDYVFYTDYDLSSLNEVEAYITKNGHLPNIPSAKQMEANGVNLKEMNLKLLEKIEELTLYTIQQEKELEKQQRTNTVLESRLAKLESLLNK